METGDAVVEPADVVTTEDEPDGEDLCSLMEDWELLSVNSSSAVPGPEEVNILSPADPELEPPPTTPDDESMTSSDPAVADLRATAATPPPTCSLFRHNRHRFPHPVLHSFISSFSLVIWLWKMCHTLELNCQLFTIIWA